MDTSSLTDWLLPEILLQYDDDDMGVAGRGPRDPNPESRLPTPYTLHPTH
jgi:hypothetical protein